MYLLIFSATKCAIWCAKITMTKKKKMKFCMDNLINSLIKLQQKPDVATLTL